MNETPTTAARSLRVWLSRRILLLLAVAALGLVWASVAQAGYATQPASGSTVAADPTFEVYLDSTDTFPQVYVSSSTEMGTYFTPVHSEGSCTPRATATANTYSCKPSFYNSTLSSRLKPGVYVWWLTLYKRDASGFGSTLTISGPLQITVPTPTAPTGVSLLTPAPGETVYSAPTLHARAPANATISFHASNSAQPRGDGSTPGIDYAGCSTATGGGGGEFTCPVDSNLLIPGETYYWWVVITVGGDSWIYQSRSFTYQTPEPDPDPGDGGGGGGDGSGGGGGGSAPPPHDASFAPRLQSSQHYVGKSVKQARLGAAAYKLSKFVRNPRTVAVACWSQYDWSNISGENPESGYSVLGFWNPAMPRGTGLSPAICRSIETLLYHRPSYPNRITANGVDTLTHEMLHALGIRSEAQTECFAMQLSYFTDTALGIPPWHAARLSHLAYGNYGLHPPSYVNRRRCRENGAWDLWPDENSLPWQDFDL